MNKIVSVLMLALFMVGCGSGSEGGSSGGDSSGGNPPEKVFENRTWTFNYNDGTSLSENYFGVTYNDTFYGANETKFVIGKVSKSISPVVWTADFISSDGELNFTMGKISPTLYMGKFDDTNQTGSTTMAGYNYTGRDQSTLVEQWKTRAGSVFKIDEEGTFSVVHDQTGCLISGSIVFLEKGTYSLTGTASACINGELEGAFRGMGMIPVNVNTNGIAAKFFSSVLIFSEGTTSESLSPFYISTL